MSQTKVSVIIPTHNREKTIERAIKSIQNQTFLNWELIVVDDGSTDKTVEILEQLSQADKRISYFMMPTNGGANKARNKGVELSNTELLSFLDSDDEMHPSNLEKQIIFFNNSNISVSYVGADIYINNEKQFSSHPQINGHIEKHLYLELKGLGASLSGITARKEVLKKAGLFNETLPSQQDLDFLVRVARYFRIDYLINCNAIIHTDATNRISDNNGAKIDGERLFVQQHKQRMKDVGVFHVVSRKLARKYVLYKSDFASALKCLGEAIAYRPFYFYAYLYALKLPFLYLKTRKN